MNRLIFLITCTLVLFSCEKNKDVEFINQYINYSLFVQVQLDNENRMTKVKQYDGGNLTNTFTFSYTDTLVTRMLNDETGTLTQKTIYYLDTATGLATNSVDTVFNGNTTLTRDNSYTYDNEDYLEKLEFNLEAFESGKIVESGNGTFHYTIANGNVVSIKYQGSSNISDTQNCTNQLEYNDSENMLDILNFQGNYLGKTTKNLIKTIEYNTDCTKKDYIPAESQYSYSFDEEGLVKSLNEKYTPSYHEDATKVGINKYKTVYEYVYN